MAARLPCLRDRGMAARRRGPASGGAGARPCPDLRPLACQMRAPGRPPPAPWSAPMGSHCAGLARRSPGQPIGAGRSITGRDPRVEAGNRSRLSLRGRARLVRRRALSRVRERADRLPVLERRERRRCATALFAPGRCTKARHARYDLHRARWSSRGTLTRQSGPMTPGVRGRQELVVCPCARRTHWPEGG